MTSPPCPRGGVPTDPDDRYCAGCGEELPPPPPPELRCETCGELRDLEDLYCAGCGEKLPDVSAEPRGEERRSEPSPLTPETAEGSPWGTSTTAPAPTEEEGEAPPAPSKAGGEAPPAPSKAGGEAPPNKAPPKEAPAARKGRKKPPPKKKPLAKKKPARKTPAKTAGTKTAIRPAKKTEKQPQRQPKPTPAPQPVPQETRRISRWWPESRGGRTAYGAILVAAGIFGFIAGEGNPLGAVITPVLALILLTFWRNVWISWGGGPTRVRQATDGQAPASTQSPLPPQAADGAQGSQAGNWAQPPQSEDGFQPPQPGNTPHTPQTEDGPPPPDAGADAPLPADPDGVDETGSSGGGTLEKILGIAILLGLLALVRAFGPQVLEVLF